MTWMTRYVGIREAKAQLDQLVRAAQQGTEWIITDRGRVQERLQSLVERGWLEPPQAPRKLPLPLPLEQGLAQSWLQEDRG